MSQFCFYLQPLSPSGSQCWNVCGGFFLWHRAGFTTISLATFISLCFPLFVYSFALKGVVRNFCLSPACPHSPLWSLWRDPAGLQEMWICAAFPCECFIELYIGMQRCTHTSTHPLPLHADGILSLALASNTVPLFCCKSCAWNRYAFSLQLICMLESAVFFLVFEHELQIHVTLRCRNLSAFNIYLLSLFVERKQQVSLREDLRCL